MNYKSKSLLAAERIIRELKEQDENIKFPIDPFKILKNKNVRITFSDFDKLEGLLLYDETSSVVSINKDRRVTRQRFTAAHELGHLIMHVKDNDNFYCPIYGYKTIIEREADEFASNLLMPTEELTNQVNYYQDKNGRVGLDECLLIAEFFGTSLESCVWAIYNRLDRLKKKYNGDNIKKELKKYKPSNKRQKLFDNTNDLLLLRNLVEYSYFTIPNISNIIGIKFIQNLTYHDSRLEGLNLTEEEVNGIFADFRINGTNSKHCKEENKNIMEVLGNIEMNQYCLTTTDDIDANKIKELHKLFCKYFPFPEYAGIFRTDDNIIKGGTIQPIPYTEIPTRIIEIDNMVKSLINDSEKISVGEYIERVAIIHYNLTVLHPFGDGNGRMSRAFMNWLLRYKGLSPIYIDSNNRDEYLDALGKIDKTNDYTDLEIVIIKSMIKTMAELHESWR